MHTLNHTLERIILDADGRYLEGHEFSPLEGYISSYKTRLHTYQQLRDCSDALIIQALQKLAQAYPELVQRHGQRCKYDMTEVLRYVALSVLRDDDVYFREKILIWLDTILLAHKQNSHCGAAYRYLQEAIAATMPNSDASLIRPYLDLIIQTLQSHA